LDQKSEKNRGSKHHHISVDILGPKFKTVLIINLFLLFLFFLIMFIQFGSFFYQIQTQIVDQQIVKQHIITMLRVFEISDSPIILSTNDLLIVDDDLLER